MDEVRIWNIARTYEQIRDTKDDELPSGTGARRPLGAGRGIRQPQPPTAPPTPLRRDARRLADVAYRAVRLPAGCDRAAGAAQASARSPANGSVALTWTANSETDLAGYNVYRGTSPGVSTAGTPLNGDTLLADRRATRDTTAANGTTYYYAVTAVDTSNNKAATEVSATPSATLDGAAGSTGRTTTSPSGPLPPSRRRRSRSRRGSSERARASATSTGTGGSRARSRSITKGRNEAEGSNVDMNYFLGIDTATNQLAVDFEEGAAGATPGLNHPLIGNTAITNGVWHHAAATYDGTTWHLYLDGQLGRRRSSSANRRAATRSSTRRSARR